MANFDSILDPTGAGDSQRETVRAFQSLSKFLLFNLPEAFTDIESQIAASSQVGGDIKVDHFRTLQENLDWLNSITSASTKKEKVKTPPVARSVADRLFLSDNFT